MKITHLSIIVLALSLAIAAQRRMARDSFIFHLGESTQKISQAYFSQKARITHTEWRNINGKHGDHPWPDLILQSKFSAPTTDRQLEVSNFAKSVEVSIRKFVDRNRFIPTFYEREGNPLTLQKVRVDDDGICDAFATPVSPAEQSLVLEELPVLQLQNIAGYNACSKAFTGPVAIHYYAENTVAAKRLKIANSSVPGYYCDSRYNWAMKEFNMLKTKQLGTSYQASENAEALETINRRSQLRYDALAASIRDLDEKLTLSYKAAAESQAGLDKKIEQIPVPRSYGVMMLEMATMKARLFQLEEKFEQLDGYVGFYLPPTEPPLKPPQIAAVIAIDRDTAPTVFPEMEIAKDGMAHGFPHD